MSRPICQYNSIISLFHCKRGLLLRSADAQLHLGDPLDVSGRRTHDLAIYRSRPRAMLSVLSSHNRASGACTTAQRARVRVGWPRERFLELAPRYWPITRRGIDPI